MKKCSSCGESKPLEEFHKKANAKDGRQSKCKPCNNASVRKWQADNPEAWEKIWRRNSYGDENNLKRRARAYGLTVDELKDLLIKADGKCEICEQPPTRWLVVDHCHKGGNVRGILCEQCNQALGLFRDNPEVMQRAINYLKA